MKRKILISLLMCFSIVSILSAQDNQKENKRKADFEKFRAQRVAFITERVQFTPEEAEAFWPLCNELQEKKFQLNKPLRDERRAQRNSKQELTDADYLKIIDTNADIKIKEAELDKEYLEKFKKILSPKKIFKYQRAEEEFMRQLFAPGGERGDRQAKSPRNNNNSK